MIAGVMKLTTENSHRRALAMDLGEVCKWFGAEAVRGHKARVLKLWATPLSQGCLRSSENADIYITRYNRGKITVTK